MLGVRYIRPLFNNLGFVVLHAISAFGLESHSIPSKSQSGHCWSISTADVVNCVRLEGLYFQRQKQTHIAGSEINCLIICIISHGRLACGTI